MDKLLVCRKSMAVVSESKKDANILTSNPVQHAKSHISRQNFSISLHELQLYISSTRVNINNKNHMTKNSSTTMSSVERCLSNVCFTLQTTIHTA